MKMTRGILAALLLVFSTAGQLVLVQQSAAQETELAEVSQKEAELARAEAAAQAQEGDIILAKDGKEAYQRWLEKQTTDFLLARIAGRLNAVDASIAKIRQALDSKGLPEAQALLDAEGETEKFITDADNINKLLNTRSMLSDTQRETLTGYRQKLDSLRTSMLDARAELASQRQRLTQTQILASAQDVFEAASEQLAAADNAVNSAQTSFSRSETRQAMETCFAAQNKLKEALDILHHYKEDSGANFAAVSEDFDTLVTRAENLRVNLCLILADVYTQCARNETNSNWNLLAIKDLVSAMRLSDAELQRLVGERAKELKDDRLAEAIMQLDPDDEMKLGDRLALEDELKALSQVDTPVLSASKMDKYSSRVKGQFRLMNELALQAATSEAALMPEKADDDLKIRTALKSGQLYMQNGSYFQAREQFEQVLVRDPYNIQAIRSMAKLDAAMEHAANEKLDALIKDRISEVRWAWSEPVTPLMQGSASTNSTDTIRKSEDSHGVNKKLDEIVIQHLHIDNETLGDVLNEILPRQIKQADPEGEGINIVPMLQPMADAGDAGYIPAGYASGNGEGGTGGGTGGEGGTFQDTTKNKNN